MRRLAMTWRVWAMVCMLVDGAAVCGLAADGTDAPKAADKPVSKSKAEPKPDPQTEIAKPIHTPTPIRSDTETFGHSDKTYRARLHCETCLLSSG
jgi:hypothetical protein